MSATATAAATRVLTLEIPAAGWAAHCQGRRMADLVAQSDQAAELAQQSVWTAQYLGARSAGVSHEAAVRRGNEAVASVRRALGYSILRDDRTA